MAPILVSYIILQNLHSLLIVLYSIRIPLQFIVDTPQIIMQLHHSLIWYLLSLPQILKLYQCSFELHIRLQKLVQQKIELAQSHIDLCYLIDPRCLFLSQI